MVDIGAWNRKVTGARPATVSAKSASGALSSSGNENTAPPFAARDHVNEVDNPVQDSEPGELEMLLACPTHRPFRRHFGSASFRNGYQLYCSLSGPNDGYQAKISNLLPAMMTRNGMANQCASRIVAGWARRPFRRISARGDLGV